MAVITTKYSVGDTVWHAGKTTEGRQHPCPDCNGTKLWQAVSPAGDEFSFGCPRCSTSYSSFDDMSLKYQAYTPCVRPLTIGSVRHDSKPWNEGPSNEYMCEETGVGSGSIYKEHDLFTDEESARRSAEADCAIANNKTEWVAKRYSKTLEISDYQLSSAALKLAKDQESKARQMLWNLNDLFAEIEESDDKEAILDAVSEYKTYSMERDQESAKVAA